MANREISRTHARRAAVLAADIEAGAVGLALRPGVSDAMAGRVMGAARSVRCHLTPQDTAAGPVAVDLRAAAGAAGELVRALHVLAQDHPCGTARRQVRLAGMLHVMIVELGGAAERKGDGDAVA